MSAQLKTPHPGDDPIRFEFVEFACFPTEQHPELIRRAAQFPASTYFGRGFRGMARRAMNAYIDATPSLTKIPKKVKLLEVWEDLLIRSFHNPSQRPGHPSLLAMHFRAANTTPGAALRDAVYSWLAVCRVFLLGDLIECRHWQPFFHALKETSYCNYKAEVIKELNCAPAERTWPIIDNQSILAERLQTPPSETKAASSETIPPPGETIGVPRGTLVLSAVKERSGGNFPEKVSKPTPCCPPGDDPPGMAATSAVEPAPCCKEYPFCGCPEIPKILPVKVVEEGKPRWRYKRPN